MGLVEGLRPVSGTRVGAMACAGFSQNRAFPRAEPLRLPQGCISLYSIIIVVFFNQETTLLRTFSWEVRNLTPPTLKVTSLERTWI